ncbi:pilus assembly FimT family protein [Almyronema epifaneia]|uniref:Tfp pilus assembly protein FimT/FimU n=1 Tax=Almyronema epifaneia S1 TaxID=2991925 RepID=A0ABW6IED0_9CYAN
MRSQKAKPIPDETTAGFTLIEVLLVVLMVGILMGIAAPGWLAFADRQRMSTVRSDLLEVLRQAQADARQNRETRVITILDDALPSLQVGSAASVGTVEILARDSVRPDYVDLTGFASVSGAWEASTAVSFDYEGLPDSDQIPFKIEVSPRAAAAKQCVIIANLLGTLKTGSGDECDDPGLAVD